MAATLMEIKSKLLLPREEGAAKEEEDPRLELVKQLIEYKKYKEAAALLEEHAERQLTRLPRIPMEMPAAPDLAQQPLRKVELWDLVSAFGRLMRETAALQPSHIIIDETPIQVHMDRIVDLLEAARPHDVERNLHAAAHARPTARPVPGDAGVDQGTRPLGGPTGRVRRGVAMQ